MAVWLMRRTGEHEGFIVVGSNPTAGAKLFFCNLPSLVGVFSNLMILKGAKYSYLCLYAKSAANSIYLWRKTDFCTSLYLFFGNS